MKNCIESYTITQDARDISGFYRHHFCNGVITHKRFNFEGSENCGTSGLGRLLVWCQKGYMSYSTFLVIPTITNIDNPRCEFVLVLHPTEMGLDLMRFHRL